MYFVAGYLNGVLSGVGMRGTEHAYQDGVQIGSIGFKRDSIFKPVTFSV